MLPGMAKVIQTPEAVVASQWPTAVLRPQTIYLTEPEADAIGDQAGTPLDSRVIHVQQVVVDGQEVATLYFDRHKVRTLPETLVIAVSPEGKVLWVEVLVFQEPQNYLPRPGWLKLFAGHTDPKELTYRKNIDGITGATLTGRAVTNAVKRALAIHQRNQVDTDAP